MERVKCLERLQMAEGFLYSRLDVCRGPGIARYFKVKSGGQVYILIMMMVKMMVRMSDLKCEMKMRKLLV